MSESSEQAVRQPPRTPSRSMAQDGLGDFLRSARVNWWLVLLMFSGATAGVTAWTVRQPRIFEATCTIEFDPNPPRPLGNDIDDVASPMANFWMSREFFATQERVMSSRVVAERVVQRLGLQRQRSFLFEPTMVATYPEMAAPPGFDGAAQETRTERMRGEAVTDRATDGADVIENC